jgi:putative hydrolase of the HAD superfamily
MNPLIAFDWGGVVIEQPTDAIFAEIHAQTGWSLQDLALRFNEAGPDWQRGRLTEGQFWEPLAGHKNLDNLWYPAFAKVIRLQPEIVEWMHYLQTHGYDTCLFSNTEASARPLLNEIPEFRHFDFLLLSFEHDCVKPEPKIYETLIALADRPPSEILFLDDRAENVAAAMNHGIGAIHVTNPADAVSNAKSWLQAMHL